MVLPSGCQTRKLFRTKMNTQAMLIVLLSLCALCIAKQIVAKSPPEPYQTALMARYIMHTSDWVSIATISTQPAIKGYPFVSLKSLSDGPVGNSTGIPYLYMTSMDVTGHDLESDTKVTIMATLAQSDYCRQEDYDPQDPRCAKVLMTGTFEKINASSPEYQFGEACLFARHPVMKDWPKGHDFFVSKVNPIQIDVLDYFGGIKNVSISDYFNANVTSLINFDDELHKVSVVEVDA